ncbi:MAG: CehA/McbA family metallohydrolase [Aggregatilineales bacterium]
MDAALLTGRADLHMHTDLSDGLASAREMLDYAAEHCQLDVIAITDHDCIEASLWACAQQAQYPFEIVPGVEVTSADGHVLALWVTELIPTGLSLAETTAAIHEQGGLAVIAHPFEPMIAPHTFLRYLQHPQVLLHAGIDAVEVHNAGAFTRGCNWLARRVNRTVKLPVVGNSDAHTPACIGTGVTRFLGKTAADLRQSLVLGTTSAEGVRWPITTYWKIYTASRQKKQSAFSGTNAPSTRPIQL